jgi:protein gp37
MNESKITWTETTWSPVIGCTKVSQGCKHCYAEREVETRWSKNPKSIWYGRSFGDVLCRPEVLSGARSPMKWKKPRRIFVCPRADLFHDEVPDHFLDRVFAVMAACPDHTFQVLTKRPARMLSYLSGIDPTPAHHNFGRTPKRLTDVQQSWPRVAKTWPLPNVWLGVSIEDQATADERIPLLLETPAAVRWVSAEPLLGPVDIRPYLDWSFAGADMSRPDVDWVVAGGESGPQARPMHPRWVQSLRDQCAAAGVPFLFKQWGEWVRWSTAFPATGVRHMSAEDGKMGDSPGYVDGDRHVRCDTEPMARVGVRNAGRLLDGVLHDAYPEVQP